MAPPVQPTGSLAATNLVFEEELNAVVYAELVDESEGEEGSGSLGCRVSSTNLIELVQSPTKNVQLVDIEESGLITPIGEVLIGKVLIEEVAAVGKRVRESSSSGDLSQ